ncbi:MAG TPA: carboxypeptidase-like regulatory domain-containing protein [Verrucomicrobiae bacterium]|jgi:hypothetical protein|nr:carboxypeptidase-like regulatory domain-containing protein [Verrucomicrobiae bacterium]
MSNPFDVFKMRLAQWMVCGFALVAMMFARPAAAQNPQPVVITRANVNDLQTALGFRGLTTTQLVLCEFNGTIVLNGLQSIAGNIILEAQTNFNVTIQGPTSSRTASHMFQVQSNVTFTMENLIISGGVSRGTNGANGGPGVNNSFKVGGNGTNGTSGGFGFGGAVYNLGTNIVINCIFLTNSATGGNGGNGGGGGSSGVSTGGNGGSGGNGGFASGGAIYNLGTLVLSNCTFAGNGTIAGNGGTGGTNGAGGTAYAGGGGGGGLALGAAIYNQGKAFIQACTFDFNFCEGGNSQTAGGAPGGNGNGPAGAIGGSADGAGIYSVGASANIQMINCTFSQNVAIGGGGGNGGVGTVLAGAAGNGGNGAGAAVFNDTGSVVAATNCTFAEGSVFGGTNGNIGASGLTGGVFTGLIGEEVGGNIVNVGTFVLANSILAYVTNGGNIYGNITDAGFNISDDGTPVIHNATTQVNLDPILFNLSTNGGPTSTYYLDSSSPAIDAITNTNTAFPAFDQRGFPRPIGQFADIGAVEFGTPSYSISGQILPAVGNFVLNEYTNVTINAVGSGLTYTAMPNAVGVYSFPNLPPDIYTVTPQPTNGFSFNPLNFTVTLANTNPIVTGSNFLATPSFTLGGIISNLTSTATVALYVTNNGNNTFFAQTTTAPNGIYMFTNAPTQNYIITPVPSSTTSFSPPSLFVSNPTADNTNLNFNAVLPTYLVTGLITNNGGAIITVNANSSVSATTHTDANGNYAFNLIAGTYVVTPQAAGFTFSPPSIQVSVPPATNLSVFTAQGSATSGAITGQVMLGTTGSRAYANAMVIATSGTSSYLAMTDSGGNYTINGLPSASYVVSAQPAALFSPSGTSVPSLSGTVGNINFRLMETNSSLAIARGTNTGSMNLSFEKWIPFQKYRIQSSVNRTNWQDFSTNTPGTNTAVVPIPLDTTTNHFFRAVTP